MFFVEAKKRKLMDDRCQSMEKLRNLILSDFLPSNGRFHIGGNEKYAYERFFRVQPSGFMSKPQFLTAMSRTFGEGIIHPKRNNPFLSHLFDTFDFNSQDSMNWRNFLSLLLLKMFPDLTHENFLRHCFAIYSSFGSFDLDCPGTMPFGLVKEMLCVPVLLPLHGVIYSALDESWVELAMKGIVTTDLNGRPIGTSVDDFRVNFKLFQTIMKDTKFGERFIAPHTFFITPNSKTPWTNVLEDEYYHPDLSIRLRIVRKEMRDDKCCFEFLTEKQTRRKEMTFLIWKKYVRNRNVVRRMVVHAHQKWYFGNIGQVFDLWRKFAIECHVTLKIQRVTRGFLGRCRSAFQKRMKNRVIKIQSAGRSIVKRQIFLKYQTRRHWAAVTIQRHLRGFFSRLRVRKIVLSRLDTGRRVLQKDRERWMLARQFKASVAICCAIRKFLRRKKRLKKMEEERMKEYLDKLQKQDEERLRIDEEVYKKDLERWYLERKMKYDEDRFLEHHTAEERHKIIAYRNRQQELDRLEKEEKRIKLEERLEEERIEAFLQHWEEIRLKRGKERAEYCRRCLTLPETKEEAKFAKELQKKIKKHLKNVLRRADKQRIPMEIPEATDLATTEVIEMEAEEEMKRVLEERFQEATRIQTEMDLKAERDKDLNEKANLRKRDQAIHKIQGCWRMFLARQILRQKAYKRFKKHFDPEAHDYYYEDIRTQKTFWEKPISLGSYDIDPEEGWMVLKTKNNNYNYYNENETDSSSSNKNTKNNNNKKEKKKNYRIYFYHPLSWAMQWEQPTDTVLCDSCQEDFAVCRMSSDQRFFCESCFNTECHEQVTRGVDPMDINFKKFNGNRINALRNTKFSFLPETNWAIHLMSNDETMMKAMQLAKEKADFIRKYECSKCSENAKDIKLKSSSSHSLRSISQAAARLSFLGNQTQQHQPSSSSFSSSSSFLSSSSSPSDMTSSFSSLSLDNHNNQHHHQHHHSHLHPPSSSLVTIGEGTEEEETINIPALAVFLPPPSVPKKIDATKFCEICNLAFCDVCYQEKHARPPWTLHRWTPVIKPNADEIAGLGLGGKGKGKGKGKGNNNRKSSIVNEGGGGGGGGKGLRGSVSVSASGPGEEGEKIGGKKKGKNKSNEQDLTAIREGEEGNGNEKKKIIKKKKKLQSSSSSSSPPESSDPPVAVGSEGGAVDGVRKKKKRKKKVAKNGGGGGVISEGESESEIEKKPLETTSLSSSSLTTFPPLISSPSIPSSSSLSSSSLSSSSSSSSSSKLNSPMISNDPLLSIRSSSSSSSIPTLPAI